MLARFPDGVFLVELAPLTDPNLVLTRVASVLSIREQLGQPLASLLTHALGDKEVLLVMDNCEHLIEAAARAAHDLLSGCPRLCILATSREPLRTSGEVVWRLPSLSLPQPEVVTNPNIIARYEAIRLFILRAAAAAPGFSLNTANAPIVRNICEQLDGIPLAIELAAARLRVMDVREVAQRLSSRFHLLVGGDRTVAPRQQTLRAAIDWSYDLLSIPEQTLLRRLSIFAGGFTLEAAAAVCADERLQDYEIVELATQLVDKSLVIKEDASSEPRYHLLETIRQYEVSDYKAKKRSGGR